MQRKILLIPLIAMMFMNSCTMKQKADLLITNARIYTVDSNFSTTEALAVKGGVILATGTTRQMLDAFESDNLIDAAGNCIYPGFIDGHCHYFGYAKNLYQYVELAGTASYEEVLNILKSSPPKPSGAWILGRGWDQNDWPGQNYPDNTHLDKLFPDNPVMLIRIDGHALLANSLALKLAGMNEHRKIEGGQIVMKDGKMTGILVDNAADSLKAAIPVLTKAEKKLALQEAEKRLFTAGLTGVNDAGLEYETVMLMDTLLRNGELKIKINAMLEPSQENISNFMRKGPYRTGKLNVRAIKLYTDGALGSRGALLLEPYSDDTENLGLQINSEDYYREMLNLAFDNGYQVCTHCIGDSANRLMLKLYGEILQGGNERRWRIEHAQVVHKEDIALFGKYNVIPSIQSTHCTSDMYWAADRLGHERIRNAYAYKALLDQNGWLINGTDFPVEDISPLKTFYAAVSRQDLSGYPEGGFQPDNGLTREQALRSITIWAAMGSFDEDHFGSLEPGKKADFVILDRDILEVPIRHVPDAKVLSTFIDGEIVYNVGE
jgi:predicted amidohydrolase YtcJ